MSNLRHNKKGDTRCVGDTSKCLANPENYKIEDRVELYIDLDLKMKYFRSHHAKSDYLKNSS